MHMVILCIVCLGCICVMNTNILFKNLALKALKKKPVLNYQSLFQESRESLVYLALYLLGVPVDSNTVPNPWLYNRSCLNSAGHKINVKTHNSKKGHYDMWNWEGIVSDGKKYERV